MKKVIYLFSIIFLLASMIGCGDDSNSSSSSPTSVDFSSDDPFSALDSYLFISGTDSEFRIMIATKDNVTSSELTINGNVIDINGNWMDFSQFDQYFSYGILIDNSMIPTELVMDPGTELDIHFNLNGTSYNQVMTLPAKPNVQTQALDLESDFTVNWTLSENAQSQVVDFQCESYFWDDSDDGVWLDAEVSGSTRSYTFSKSNYSQYIIPGYSWYEYGVQAINYKLSGKNIIVLASDDYNEEYSYKNIDTEKKVLKINNLIKALAQ